MWGSAMGYDTAGADIALADLDNNGQLDLVLAQVDAPSGANTMYYKSAGTSTPRASSQRTAVAPPSPLDGQLDERHGPGHRRHER